MKKLSVLLLMASVGAFAFAGCSQGNASGAADAVQAEGESAEAEETKEGSVENAENQSAENVENTGREGADAAAESTGVSANVTQDAPAGGFDLGGKTDFIVGFDADFPPYGYVDDSGDYVGFDLDLAAEAAKRLGLNVVYQPIDWDSKDMELDSGAIDCIWNGFTMSDERLDAYEWTEAYVDNSQVVVTSPDSGIASLSDLAGKILCVQADSSALESLESEEHAELKASLGDLMQVPEYNTAFMNLEAGAVDAIAMDVGVAKYQIESRNADFVILDEKLESELYGVGFKKGNTVLRDAVQSVMNDMAADGTFDEIATKWGQQDSVVIGK